jgi:head-tail adaptor
MKAGELREKVSLQMKSVTRDTLNGEVVTWATQNELIPAEVTIVSGRFANVADQIHEPTTIRVRIRRGPQVSNLWRVLWREKGATVDRILNVQAVLPIPHNEGSGIDLLCSEGINDG